MGADSLKKLEYMSLISKVCTELETHIGFGNKVLAEFITELGQNCDTVDEFETKVKDIDASLPDYFVRTLFTIIHAVLPAKQKLIPEKSEFPALKVTDSKDRVNDLGTEIEEDVNSLRRLGEDAEEGKYRDKDRYGNGDEMSGCDDRDRNDDDDDDDDDDYGGRQKRSESDRHENEDEHNGRDGYNEEMNEEMNGCLEEPELYKVYKGRVSRVMNAGCFVQLDQLRGKEGLVHVSQIPNRRIGNVKEVVKHDQEVYVKVISVSGNKLTLSMKDVDQNSGKDLLPLTMSEEDEFRTNHSGRYDDSVPLGRSLKRMSVKQLIASGAISMKECFMFDEGGDELLHQEEGAEEELEIEMNEEEPVFLQGRSWYSVDMSPVKIFKNPEGSLSRAAALKSALIKETRQVREQQQRAMLGLIPKDLNRPWEDPMPETGERHLAQELKGVGWSTYGKAVTFGQRPKLSVQEQRRSLPIYKLKNELIQAIHDNQVLVVIGETGSGKTTQVTQYLAEAGYTTKGKIGCTQPCRVAATSVAKRVADEFGCRLGEEVGYAIHFEDCTGPETVIKYMTDALLLSEILMDEDLSQYSVIMLDEAHERTVHTDVLLGLLKQLVKRRPDLRLIVTSETLDAEKFSGYFFSCNIFTIPGRTSFPVEILYTKQPESDYLDASLITVLQIHLTEPEGDILVFLTGQEEIHYACQCLYERMKGLGKTVPELIILPVYSSLPSEMQSIIFEPAPGKRKVVVAAEASLTIDGISYVIDPGFAKQNVYNPKRGLDSLVITPISQASAKQRAERAGRTGPGKCYRLYTESTFHNEMSPTSIPEIQRINLGSTTLTMKAMGINDLSSFDFMDPPSPQALVEAMEQLSSLRALDEEELLTNLGRKMADFPLDPPLSKMLVSGVDIGCSDEILTIIAMIQAGDVFYQPRKKQTQVDEKRSKFFQPEGDYLTLLAVYEAWKSRNFSSPWCSENFIQSRSLRKAHEVRKQLLSIMDKYKLDVVSGGNNFTKIRKAIAAGFFFHVAKKDPQEGYRTLVGNQEVYIHPSSALFHRQPEWVIYHELVMTTKEYMRGVTVIDPKWLVELAPKFFKADTMNLILGV